MNTLGKNITETFFTNAGGYDALKARWASLIAAKTELGPEQHLLYLVLRGKDWRKGFTPTTNRKKIENGGLWNSGIHRAAAKTAVAARFKGNAATLVEPFGGIVSPEGAMKALAYLGDLDAYQRDRAVEAYQGAAQGAKTAAPKEAAPAYLGG